jgi:hypothetical protein
MGKWYNLTLLSLRKYRILLLNHRHRPHFTSCKATLLLWAGYLLLAGLLTWPTVTHLATHLPGDGGDDPALAWNLWWVKYALLNTGQNPFQTDYLFYPIGINLAFYTLTVLNAVTSLPITLNAGVVTAANLHLFFSFAAGGYGAFLLIRYLLALSSPVPRRAAWLAAALAGGMYAFAGSKLFYVALGQFNIASSHWIPYAVLYLIRAHRQPRPFKNAVMAGLFLTLQAWAELTYASFLLIFMALYGLYWLAAAGLTRPALRRLLVPYALIGLTFLLGLSPILAQMAPDMRTEGDFLVEGSGFAEAFSADALGFFIPTMLHPVLGNLIRQTGIGAPGSITGFDKGQHLYLGLSLLGLVVIAAVAGRRSKMVWFWLLAAAAFSLLTLGPSIVINGQSTDLPGPFVLLQHLPFFKGNRYPSRYSVMLILSLSVLAGFGLAWLAGRWRSQTATRWALAGVAALFLFEHLSAPLPQSDMRLPMAYQPIAADPGQFTVLDIPFAWRNGFRITGALTTGFMFGQFYQTGHQKPLLQGNTSRNPQFKFDYFSRAPFINSLLALETGKTLPEERVAADRAIAAGVLNFFNIRYVVVRPDSSGNPAVTPQNTLPYLQSLWPLEPVSQSPEAAVYRVEPPPPAPNLAIASRAPLAPRYFGEGWGLIIPGQPIAAQRREVSLFLPLTDTPHRATLNMYLPDNFPLDGQTVALSTASWQSPPQPMIPGGREYYFDLPAEATRPGLNEIRVRFGQVAATPIAPVMDVTVHSAGQEVGGFGHIYVNGREVSPNRRGYNVAIINQPAGPAPQIKVAAFDTHLEPLAAAGLHSFVQAAPPEATIAIAAADEASLNLSPEAAAAVQFGGAGMQGCFRCSHGVIRQADGFLTGLSPLQPVALSTHLASRNAPN